MTKMWYGCAPIKLNVIIRHWKHTNKNETMTAQEKQGVSLPFHSLKTTSLSDLCLLAWEYLRIVYIDISLVNMCSDSLVIQFLSLLCMTINLYSMGLLISSQHYQWPEKNELSSLFAHFKLSQTYDHTLHGWATSMTSHPLL